MSTMIVGDWHGSFSWMRAVFNSAHRHKIDRVLQVGDFGAFWTGSDDNFTRIASIVSQENEIPLFFIDGNHENFDVLQTQGALSHDGPVEILPNLTYLPRGTIWEWDGMSWFGMGGAYSVDKASRTPHLSWWPQEEITQLDYRKAAAALDSHGPVDIMVTHDAPWGHVLPGEPSEWESQFPKAEPNRRALRAVLNIAKPKVLVHGHFHYRYSNRDEHGFAIEGLGCEGDFAGAAVVVRDTPTIEPWSLEPTA